MTFIASAFSFPGHRSREGRREGGRLQRKEGRNEVLRSGKEGMSKSAGVAVRKGYLGGGRERCERDLQKEGVLVEGEGRRERGAGKLEGVDREGKGRRSETERERDERKPE